MVEPVLDENNSDYGYVNWSDQYIEAEGSFKVEDETKFPEKIAKERAIRGALIVARRNLLETINGVYINSSTTVADQISMSDTIKQTVSGLIKGANLQGKPIFSGGVCTVKVRMPLYKENGLASAFVPKDNTKDTESKIENESSVEIGKLNVPTESSPNSIDNTKRKSESITTENTIVLKSEENKEYKPVLFPKICHNGKVLIDMEKMYSPKSGKFPKFYSLSKEVLKEAGLSENINLLNLRESENGCFEVDESMLSSKSLKFVEKIEGLTESKLYRVLSAVTKVLLLKS
jgi:hypothetical protein